MQIMKVLTTWSCDHRLGTGRRGHQGMEKHLRSAGKLLLDIFEAFELQMPKE